jgi:hypothetical protein
MNLPAIKPRVLTWWTVGTIVTAVALPILTTAPAYAEDPAGLIHERQTQAEDAKKKERREEAAEVEKQYDKIMKNSQSNAPAPQTDPWQKVR